MIVVPLGPYWPLPKDGLCLREGTARGPGVLAVGEEVVGISSKEACQHHLGCSPGMMYPLVGGNLLVWWAEV